MRRKVKREGVPSTILGICGMICGLLCPIIGIVCGIVGLCLYKGKTRNIVLNILSIAVSIMAWFVYCIFSTIGTLFGW